MLKKGSPDQIYADLFEAVQKSHLFKDSKTFVDARPKSDPAVILASFREKSREEGFDLAAFVASNFELPRDERNDFRSDTQRPVRQHIELLWDDLTRPVESENRHSSLISLPHPYVVPGGRFREVYYWDSYFTMLGLAASGRVDLVESMVKNFAFLIDHFGFVPNGNRTYFCTRSQPPLFVLMVELLARVKQDQTILERYLEPLEKEYAFWVSGSGGLVDDADAIRRVIAADGGYLNRYWDASGLPRPESYAEDLALATESDREASGLYRDIRAACESGWDFGSRWLENGRSMASIRTTRIVPVDLNALLYRLEASLAEGFRMAGEKQREAFFSDRAVHRKRLIQSWFFDEQDGFFADLVLPDLSPSGRLSLAAALPLFLKIATPRQARRVAEKIQTEFLRPGGWVTTLCKSGQQWDSPNGWAPLQWIVYVGLRNYGFSAQAEEGARRWVENNVSVYRSSGRLLEKYNVEEIGKFAEGGEYTIQDGFGWTNGVLLCFMNELGID